MLKHAFRIAFALIITATAVPALAGMRLPDTAPIPAERPFVAPDLPDVHALLNDFLDRLGCYNDDDNGELLCPTTTHSLGGLPATSRLTITEVGPWKNKLSTTTPISCKKRQWLLPKSIPGGFRQTCVVDGIHYELEFDLQVGWEI